MILFETNTYINKKSQSVSHPSGFHKLVDQLKHGCRLLRTGRVVPDVAVFLYYNAGDVGVYVVLVEGRGLKGGD